MSRALARLTPSPGDVEREGARRESPRARQRLGREQRAQLVERFDVGHGVRTWGATDRGLVDEDDVRDRLPTIERPHLAHRLAQMLLGGVASLETRFELPEQDVVYERRLAGSRDAGDGGEGTERDAGVDAPEVVQARTCDTEPAPGGPPRRRHPDALFTCQVLSGEGPGSPNPRSGPLVDERATRLAAPGPQLHHPVGGLHRGRVVLDYHHGIAAVREPPQQTQQPTRVGGMQADGRLVQHIQCVDQVGSERVGEGDALRLSPRQSAREPVEGEVPQPYVVHERDPGGELVEDVHGHCAPEWRELEVRDPIAYGAGRQGGDVGDGPAAHADSQRLRLEARAAAGRTGFRELVLPEEDADVLLVPFGLEALQERQQAEESATGAVEEEMPGLVAQIPPPQVERDPLRPGGLTQDAATALVARLGPGIERTLREALPGIGHDERLVVLEDCSEAVAARARASGMVERKQDRREAGRRRAAIGAGGVCRKAPAVAVLERDRHALTLVECRGDRVRQAPAIPFQRRQPVHDHQHFLSLSHALLGIRRIEPDQCAVDLRPHEAGGTELRGDFDIGTMRARRQWERDQHRLGLPPASRSHELVHHLLHGVGLDHVTALHAVLDANARPEETQEVVDLGGRAHGRATARGGILLLYGHRWRDPLDPVHQRLRHPFEELFRVGRQGLDVAALAFGIQGVERQGALPGPRRPGHHREGATRQRHGNALEVVLPRVADEHTVGRAGHNPLN